MISLIKNSNQFIASTLFFSAIRFFKSGNVLWYAKLELLIVSFLFFLFSNATQAQSNKGFVSTDIFQTSFFIESHGQFSAYNDGNYTVQYAVENKGDRFYFNNNGFISSQFYLIKKEEPFSAIKKIFRNKEAENEEENEQQQLAEQKIVMRWIGANATTTIESTEKSKHYFTYGTANYSSFGFKKIVYKNLYSGVDVEYIIPKRGGVKYSLIVHPGADLSKIKLQYNGKGVSMNLANDKLFIKNQTHDLVESNLKAYYENGVAIGCHFELNNGIAGFVFDTPIDSTQTIIIDPWVSQITTMLSAGAGSDKGYDVDYDYNGNLYVYGGGFFSGFAPTNLQIAKYDLNGNLKWTFNGSVSSISWESKGSNGSAGNFIVEKTSGKVYCGQGFENNIGTRIIRLDTSGVYDNYVSAANLNFREIWDMNFDCRNKNIFCMGGSVASNQNIGVVDTSGNFSAVNFTGVPTGVYPAGFGQDIVSSALDDNHVLFTLLSSGGTPSVDNQIFKLNGNYNAAVWQVASGFTSFSESNNKPYINTFASNGFNALDANNSYLYYYDGYNLSAYSKVSGSVIGSPATISGFIVKAQGGIVSDNCNHIYLGGNNGNLKVFSFNTLGFNPNIDVAIPGVAGRHVYDIKLNKGSKLLYVCGDSFVAVVNTLIPCTTGGVQLSVAANCPNKGVATLINADTTANYTYIWKDSLTHTVFHLSTNVHKFSDTVLGLVPFTIYTVTVIKNPLCGGPSKTVSFLSNYFTSAQSITLCGGLTYTIGTHTYSNAGVYIDTTINGTCATIVTTTIFVHPSYNFVRNYALCSGNAVHIGTHTYGVPGSYTDSLHTSFGCDSIIHSNVAVGYPSAFTQSVSGCTGHGVHVGNKIHYTSGVYHDTIFNYVFCDSVVTSTITFYSPSSYTQYVQLCSGHPLYVGTHAHYNAGVYADTLPNYHGCDSVVISYINLVSYTYTGQTLTLCQGDTLYVGTKKHYNTGFYVDTLASFSGCDSFILSDLSILPVGGWTQVFSICSNTPVVVGVHSYNTTGNYVDTLKGYRGCDSMIIQTYLTAYQAYNDTQHLGICNGNSVTVGFHTYTVAGIYHDSLYTQIGCDSIITTFVAVGTNTSGSQTIGLCAGHSITIGGNTHSTVGVFVDTIANFVGCDSVLTSTIFMKTNSTKTQTLTRCSNSPVTVGSHVYNTSGTFIDTLVNYKNCDSIVTTNLTIKPVSTFTQTLTRCSNHPLVVGAHTHSVSGNYLDTLVNYRGCDSVVTSHLTIKPFSAFNQSLTFCTGGSVTVGSHTHSTSGTFRDTLVNYVGCDSIIITVLVVHPKNNINQNINLCFGNSITIGTHTYSTSGVYHDSLTNHFGCDSIINSTVTVYNASSYSQTLTICSNHPLTVGSHVYAVSGNYLDTIPNHANCDSIITTHLTVKQASFTAQSFTFCVGNSVTVGTHVHSTNGTFKDTLVNAMGCDSIITTVLIVHPKSTVSQTINLCIGGSFSVGLHSYSTSGIYHDTLLNKYGCDSMITTNLTIRNPSAFTQTLSICSNQTLSVGSHTYSTAGNYLDTIPNYVNCDSVITTHLSIKSTSFFIQNIVFCFGNSITVGSHTYSSTGNYLDTISNYVNCDSFVTTHLIVKPLSFKTINQTFCVGNTITVGSHTYNSSGTYHDTLLNFLGCDSIITLNLIVNPKSFTTLNQSICNGQSFTVGTHTYSTTGTYTDVLVNYLGCDSTVTLNLIVKPISTTTLNTAICNGTSISVGTHTYNTAGNYLDTLANFVGCDSIITLNLSIKQLSFKTITASICSGTVFTVGIHNYDSTGNYVDTVSNAVGCDSIITSNITVITPNVNLTAVPDTLVYAGESVTLLATLEHTTDSVMTWSPTDLVKTVDATSVITSPKNSTWYFVTTKTTEGCMATDSILIVLIDMAVPNAFTPNGDNENDIFIARGRATNSITEFSIYNRWGERIFFTTDYTQGWDGNYKGAKEELGTYNYVIKTVSKNTGTLKVWRGNVMLVR